MSLHRNASPEVIHLGTDDLSTRVISPEVDPIPQHLPKFFIKARKGSNLPMLVNAAKLHSIFGNETFDKDDAYYNHQTRFLEGVAGMANTCMVQRIIPEDAGIRSNVTLYVDVIEKQIPNYVRNSLGDYVIDTDTNAYKVNETTPTITGREIKFIAEYDDTEDVALGLKVSKNGTMTDGGNTSTMYPILQFKAKFQGEHYNNIGFAIESLYGEDVDSSITSETKVMPFNFSLYTRDHAGASPVVSRSLFGEPSVQATFKEKAKNPNTEARFDIDAIFATQWFNETDSLKPLKYNDFEGMHTYRTNLELVLKMVMDNEKAYISADSATWDDGEVASSMSWFDFNTDDADELDTERYLINLFSCKSSKNKPYFTVAINADSPSLSATQREVSISKDSPIFLNGGSDGTLDNTGYETVVVKKLQEYADPDSEVIDTAINVESVIYDSGFTLDTKKELTNFIAVRKDTAIALSTHDAELGEKDLPLSDVRAIAVALKTRVKLAPESDYFGTPVMRGIIVGGTGQMRDGSTLDRIPLTYEIALKSARMMGAGNYQWKSEYAFDHGTYAILEWLVDVTPAFIPAGIKPTLWNDGLVWAQPKDRVQYFFPAVQTVYDDDTSVLNTWTTVFAACTLNKIAADAWREFTGSNTLSDAAFKDAVLAYVNNRIDGIFDGLLTVIPEVVITEADELRGYSWNLVLKLYAPNMKTRMVTYVEAYRLSDLG